MRIVKIIIVILLSFTALPLGAATAQTPANELINYESNRIVGKDGFASTSDQSWLIAQIEYTNGVSNTTLLKATKEGVESQLSLENTLTKFVKYKGYTYVVAYNFMLQQMEIYNEQLILIDTESGVLNGKGYFEVHQSGPYISIESYSLDSWMRNRISEFLVYDFENKKLAPNAVVPYAMADVDETPDGNRLYFRDELNRVMSQINLNNYPEIPGGFVIKDVIEKNNEFTFITYQLSSIPSGKDYTLVTISKEGELRHTTEFFIPGSSYFYMKLVGDKVHARTTSSGGESKLYEYNLNTYQLIDKGLQSSGFYSYTKLKNGKVLESISGFVVMKNEKDEFLYAAESSGTPKVGEKYFIVNNQVIDIETGKVVNTLPYDIYLIEFIDRDIVYVYSEEYDVLQNITKNKHSVFSIGEEVAPPANAVPTTKMWTVHFNLEVDANSATTENAYVKDAAGDRVDVTLEVSGKKLFIHPPATGYKKGQTYKLYIGNVKAKNGKSVTNPQVKEFTAW